MNRLGNIGFMLAIGLLATACTSKSDKNDVLSDSVTIDTSQPPPSPTLTKITDTVTPPPPIEPPVGKKAEDQVKFPPPEVKPDPPIGTSANLVYDGNKLDVAPSPKEGLNQFREKLTKVVKYPEAAMKANTQGVVEVKFTVLANGVLEGIRVERKLGGGLDEEAIRAVKQLNSPWNAGKYQGKAVSSHYTLPVSFKLD